MDLILTVVIAASIPSAITGFCFWCIEQKIQKQSKKREDEEKERREAQEKRERVREQNELLLIQGVGAAIALGEALTPEYKAWGAQVVKNAAAMADELTKKGLRIVSGRTESHVMLVDLRPKHITGKAAQALLESGHMTANKNAIPNDPEKPFVTSGIRLGTAAMTTRGFKEELVREVADLIAELLDHPEDAAVLEHVKAEVAKLTKAFPVYAR